MYFKFNILKYNAIKSIIPKIRKENRDLYQNFGYLNAIYAPITPYIIQSNLYTTIFLISESISIDTNPLLNFKILIIKGIIIKIIAETKIDLVFFFNNLRKI